MSDTAERVDGPDYRVLIDQETWAFIDKTQALYPPEAATWTVAKNRQFYDEMGKHFAAGYPAGVMATSPRYQTT